MFSGGGGGVKKLNEMFGLKVTAGTMHLLISRVQEDFGGVIIDL